VIKLIEVLTRRTTAIKTRIPWGVCLHTTGGGITTKAKKKKKSPIEVALDIYLASQNGANGYPWGGPGYVIDHDGTVYKLADDTTRTNHVGRIVEGVDRRTQYRDGSWVHLCSPRAVGEWHRRWPAYQHPYELFPSQGPNSNFVGIEMIPCGDGFGTPMTPKLRFTVAQHEAAAELALDIAKRNKFPKDWQYTSRLLGHEDVGLIDRHDKEGGWDPGFLRMEPYFDLEFVRHQITEL